MAEKKKTSSTKKDTTKKKSSVKKTTKKEIKKEVKKEEIKEVKVDVPKKKKECKLLNKINNLTIEQILLTGICVIVILLIAIICVATKNTKTSDGKDIVIKLKDKTITADELYTELKNNYGQTVAIDLVDNYLLSKEYKTTSDMKKSANATIEQYKEAYKDQFEQFLTYNGIDSEATLQKLLIKNNKMTLLTEDYIKDSITEEQMKKYYEDKIYGDIEAKHILIKYSENEELSEEENKKASEKAKAKAEEVIAKLKAGEKFDDLAKEYSEDDSNKDKGGDLGYFNTGEMESAFEEAAFKLSVNEYTKEPVLTSYGYHIILKTGEKKKPTYKKSKDTIIEKIISETEASDSQISTKAIIALRKKYKMSIKDKAIKKLYEEQISSIEA